MVSVIRKENRVNAQSTHIHKGGGGGGGGGGDHFHCKEMFKLSYHIKNGSS